MAEAAVVADEHALQRFYCHMCNIKFESCTTTFSCPRCADGFIEQLEARSEHTVAAPFDSDESDEEMFDMLNLSHLNFLLPDVRPTGRIRHGADATRRAAGGGSEAGQTGANPRSPLTYENLLQEFIVNLGVNMLGGNGNMQLFLNPGDYAWGREGLDAIVTQLLNQIDTTGPPPLAKDVIDAIPVVEVNQEQVDTKLKCSVCWEEFQLAEKVRQLACQHVYHEPCIRPWLELHSTCPICRQDLGSEDQSTNTAPDNSGGTTYNALQQLFQAVHGSGGGMSSSSATTTDSTSTSNNDTTSSSSRGSDTSN
ncbi:E3 ubiquitin-protein ligase Iruka isoform X1 [Atheta coriaria]|uniref:E3 ubiquitin-protein ligase Iruka isoform X1 n=1 Tax=Dalotia coriaria TaxID=877792 RepID=UPI0031F3EE89